MRTSKKQMQEARNALRYAYPNDEVWAAGEYDATHKAYVRHCGKVTTYSNNTDAYFAVADLLVDFES